MKKLSLMILLILSCLILTAMSVSITAFEPNPPVSDDPTGPYNLTADLIDVDDIMFIWDNPVYTNQPMGYRIYCSDNVAADIGGEDNSNYFLQDVCPGCHYFYVVAYFDTGCESAPSNVVEVTVTSNEDSQTIPVSLALKVYPNPCRSEAQISIAGLKGNSKNPVTIYNVRGQLIRTLSLRGKEEVRWDGCDNYGKSAAQGIYFLRGVTAQGTVMQKLVLQK